MSKLDKKDILIKIGLIFIVLIILFSLNNYFLLADKIKEKLQCKYTQEETYIVDLDRRFTVGVGDTVKVNNTDIEIKITGFCNVGLREGWCGGKHVEFSYSIGEETKERETLYQTFEKDGYTIILLRTNFDCYATMKIEK